jgi:hypothetical protein
VLVAELRASVEVVVDQVVGEGEVHPVSLSGAAGWPHAEPRPARRPVLIESCAPGRHPSQGSRHVSAADRSILDRMGRWSGGPGP